MKRLNFLFAIALTLALSSWRGEAAVGSWNGIAFTAWNGVVQTAWNGTSISCASAGPSYLVNQNFEGTGYDNSETWTENGAAIDEDYTTSPLTGSQSVYAVSTTVQKYAESPAFTATGDGWLYCQVEFKTALPASNLILVQLRSSGGTVALLRMRSSGKFRIEQSAGVSGDTVGAFALDTKYHIWIHYVKSTGANDGICSVGVSTDGTKTTSGNFYQQTTTGTSTADVVKFRLTWDTTGAAGMEAKYDRALFDDASIGNNP